MARNKQQLALRLGRIEIANWLLEWLDIKRLCRGNNAYETIIGPFSRIRNIEIYEVWQAWDILKEAGRRSARAGKSWAIISWKPIEADAGGNIFFVS